ncbi:MAG TPA: hypothetical protein VFI91_05070 [Longimicrobiaceae bacterium]|nr:hypothetical protein [Longimicrobiaceae bacterium]
MADSETQFNIVLDENRAMKLRALSEQMQMNPAMLATILLGTALDKVEPEAATIVTILDAIPGAFYRADEGLRQIRSGKGVPLEDSPP